MGEGDQVREHQARVIPPQTCHEFRSANGGNESAPANGGNELAPANGGNELARLGRANHLRICPFMRANRSRRLRAWNDVNDPEPT